VLPGVRAEGTGLNLHGLQECQACDLGCGKTDLLSPGWVWFRNPQEQCSVSLLPFGQGSVPYAHKCMIKGPVQGFWEREKEIWLPFVCMSLHLPVSPQEGAIAQQNPA
jgi:hypothetical protein